MIVWLFGAFLIFVFVFVFVFVFFFVPSRLIYEKRTVFFYVQAFLDRPSNRADYVSSVFREKGMLFSLSWDVRC